MSSGSPPIGQHAASPDAEGEVVPELPATEETARRLAGALERMADLFERIARLIEQGPDEREHRGGPPRRSVTPAPYLTTTQAAEILGCDPKIVRSDIHAGRLRAVRVGAKGHFRIPSDALRDLDYAPEPPVAPVPLRAARPRAGQSEPGMFR
jgi:excisionase family DNA binding protein